MKNCYVKKYSKSVVNNALEKVGHAIIPVDTSVLTSGNFFILWYSDIRPEGEVVNFLDSNYNVIGSKGFNVASPTSYTLDVSDVPAGTEYIDIPGKYELVRFNSIVSNFIKKLKTSNIKFSFDLKVLSCNGADMSDISINDVAQHINEMNIYLSNIKGVTTESLSQFDSLTMLDLRGVDININVKTLAENLLRLGTYTGAINWRIKGSFDDTAIAAGTSATTFTFNNSTVQVSWNGSVLGTYNGTSWS